MTIRRTYFEDFVLNASREITGRTITESDIVLHAGQTGFPHAFIGSMSQLMRAASGEIKVADNSVEDSIYTMACVEAAYQSSESGATTLPD
jgi:hypothetical protein